MIKKSKPTRYIAIMLSVLLAIEGVASPKWEEGQEAAESKSNMRELEKIHRATLSTANRKPLSATPSVAPATPSTPPEDQEEITEPGLRGYIALTEEEYTDEIWKSFYQENPIYAVEDGTKLREEVETFFMSMYSATIEDYNGAAFGAWEIVDYAALEEAEHFMDESLYRSVWIYGRRANEPEEKMRWIKLEGAEIEPFYAEWDYHTLSASVINNNTLRIHIKARVMDNSGGDYGYCYYSLSPDATSNDYSLVLKYPWVEMGNFYPKANYGTITVLDYNSEGTSSDYGRWMRFEGYWDLSGEVLTNFKSYNTGNNLYWSAGLYKSGAYSPSRGAIYCSNLATAVNQASCPHTNKRYPQIAGNEAQHQVYCNSCGLYMGTENHTVQNSVCTKCGYVFYVEGNFIYELNGREEQESYRLKPGTECNPKEFSGYFAPGSQIVPTGGGDIRFVYTPIEYTMIFKSSEQTEQSIDVKYDDAAIQVPRAAKKKGHKIAAWYTK